MNWKFWKKTATNKDETVIQVVDQAISGVVGHNCDIYVKAQTSEKALELYDKLKERQPKHG